MPFNPLIYEQFEFKKMVESGLCTPDELVATMQKAFRNGWGAKIGPHLNIVDSLVYKVSDAAIAQHVKDQLNS